jgi:hypothetical protein
VTAYEAAKKAARDKRAAIGFDKYERWIGPHNGHGWILRTPESNKENK